MRTMNVGIVGYKFMGNFYDGMKEMEVLEAGLRSAETGKAVDIA